MSSNTYTIVSIGSQGVSLKSHILAKTINLLILANIIDHLITTIIFFANAIACSLYQLSSSSPASINSIYSFHFLCTPVF